MTLRNQYMGACMDKKNETETARCVSKDKMKHIDPAEEEQEFDDTSKMSQRPSKRKEGNLSTTLT